MRTIKFRGKRNHSGEWHYGHYTQGSFFHPASEEETVRHLIHADMLYDVDENTVGQFTGLYDKDGKEIYEGDIIGCHNPDIKHLVFYDEKEARFKAALNGDINNDFMSVCGLDDSRWNASKKVIGNIHDNPELLKGGNQ
jgi:uncharacterized phage protein (TIGR01671 family)